MFKRIFICLLIIILAGKFTTIKAKSDTSQKTFELSNSAYDLTVSLCGTKVQVRLYDKAMDLVWCEGAYIYRTERLVDSDIECYEGLESPSINQKGNTIQIKGRLAGLKLEHTFEMPTDRPIMEELLTLQNSSKLVIEMTDFETGFKRFVTNQYGDVLAEIAGDRLVAIPFRRQAGDPQGRIHDFSMCDFLAEASDESRKNKRFMFMEIPPRHHVSEGWAWMHGEYTLGVFKFNQQQVDYSVISTIEKPEGTALRFGGSCMISKVPAPPLSHIAPDQKIDFGITRYQTLKGDYTQALYTFRDMLDEKGCHFPADYNPPVHWNELYDNPEWYGVSTPGSPPEPRSEARKFSYTKALIEEEATKARDYSCESLYLDPGWDVRFGSFLWGEEWLGPCKQFVEEMESKYGLKVSLHCPLATWMSLWYRRHSDRASGLWPDESFRMDADGKIIDGSVCLVSKQYIDTAADRLLKCCEDGVCFLMFDGNRWQHSCWNPEHGHPVPYRMEDFIEANLELARRIHAKYPDVLIEMHDMIAAGSRRRTTPVYYKYGLPCSYDDNWGFELMWDPISDLKEGRGRALYYYNMGCNVPVYLHVDLSTDNEHCIVLWWFASTCRHLGIGGTHPDPLIVWRQKQAMKKYRSLERFYKRGEFYGISEEVHLHVLPEENALVLNMFNLSDEQRVIEGSIPAERLGIDLDRWYICRGRPVGVFHPNKFYVRCKMEPWSTELSVFEAP